MRRARQGAAIIALKEYPAPKPELEGIAVRLDAEPIAPPLTFATSDT
jgi:hypothetical protein